MIAQLAAIVTPIFIAAGIGFAWAKMGRPYDADLITSLAYWVGTPCLVFSILSGVELTPAAVGAMAGGALVVLAASMVAAYLVLRLSRQSVRAFLPSMMFGNAGNMGLPLSLLAFGETGLAFAITFFAIASVLNHTVGAAVAAGAMKARDILQVPMLYAALLALGFILAGTKPPEWLADTTRMLGGMVIPLLLITLGISLARMRVAGLKRSVLLSLLRFSIGIAAGFGVAELMGMTGIARGVLILQSSMPVAVFNFLFAKRFGNSADDVAGVVVVSTLIAFALLPGLMWFFLHQAGM
jgi:predicted permease